jgi:enoyl-CoA hydratase/carnithine racemase
VFDTEDGIAVATLNRPERMNTFTASTFREYLEVIDFLRG